VTADRPIDRVRGMPTVKPDPREQNGRPRPRGAPVERVDPPDFFENESTVVDAGIPADWARPAEPQSNAAVQDISRMLEEAIDGSNPQIEIQRRADAAAPLMPLVAKLKPINVPATKVRPKSDAAMPLPRRKHRTLLIVLAGTLAVAVVVLLLGRADLLPIRF
jgi:hypothetical protein